MIRGEKLTAIIPARKGSLGIPNKNLIKIDGKTLVERTLEKATHCKYIDRVLVSTNDPEIYRIAKKYNAAPPNLRPDSLASSSSETIDAVDHVLNDAQIDDGCILLLQVTTPLWELSDLENLCLEFEKNPDSDAIVSVVEHDAPHPDKILKISDGKLTLYTGRNTGIPRQNLPKVYALNGAFYLISLPVLMLTRKFVPENSIPFIMPPEKSVNLDGPLDLAMLKGLLGDSVSES